MPNRTIAGGTTAWPVMASHMGANWRLSLPPRHCRSCRRTAAPWPQRETNLRLSIGRLHEVVEATVEASPPLAAQELASSCGRGLHYPCFCCSRELADGRLVEAPTITTIDCYHEVGYEVG